MSNHRQQLEMAYRKKIKQTQEVIAKTALDIDRQLVNQTPVDTGRAKSNWIATVGVPSSETRESTTPINNEPVYNSAKFGQKIFITNNLPYIQRLNNGYSAKAPSGYVDAIVRSAQRKVKDIARVEMK